MSKNKETIGGTRRRAEASNIADDIAALEASLQIDFEAFDQEFAELARKQTPNKSLFDKLNTDPPKAAPTPATAFPTLSPDLAPPASPSLQLAPTTPTLTATEQEATQRMPTRAPVTPTRPAPSITEAPQTAPLPDTGNGSLLDMLRQQAASKQQEAAQESAKRGANTEEISKCLKQVFSYLHDLSQQLNIIKPPVARTYAIQESVVMSDLAWHEGFVDSRSQSEATNAPTKAVLFSCQLKGKKTLMFSRDAHNYERMRTQLFDFGLAFTCEEVRNARRLIERAEFVVRNEVNISLRWQADFDKGEIVLETRNLERLGTMRYTLRPQAVDHPLLEAFGRLLMGQPTNFRELMRR